MGIQVAPPHIVAIRPLKYPDRIGFWKCWLFLRVLRKNRSTRRKTSRAEKRANNKLNQHMASGPRIDPEPHWWEASALTTAPSLLPNKYVLSFCGEISLKCNKHVTHPDPVPQRACSYASELAVSLINYDD